MRIDFGLGCAELLIPHLPNINVADRPGKTPLHHAAINGHSEVSPLHMYRGRYCIYGLR